MPGNAEMMMCSIWVLWCHAHQCGVEMISHGHRTDNWAEVLQKDLGYWWIQSWTRIMDSWKHLIWKRPLRSLSPVINPAVPSPSLNHILECHIYLSFKYFQGWWLNYIPGQTVLMLDQPVSGKKIPNVYFTCSEKSPHQIGVDKWWSYV